MKLCSGKEKELVTIDGMAEFLKTNWNRSVREGVVECTGWSG